MKKRIPIAEMGEHIGEDVAVDGWVNNIRDQKSMQFVVLRNRTGMIQATNEKQGNELDATISSLTPESTVVARGRLEKNERVKLGQMELRLYDIDITSRSLGASPIASDSSQDSRMDWRYLDLRSPRNQLIFRVQTTAEGAMRRFWRERGFIEIHSPKLVEGATESGSELFQLNYFGKKASLAQSPQFYKQMAMAAGLEGIFEIGPVFRANPSYTSRHDTEFTSVDTEMSWVDSHHDVMDFEEEWLQYALGAVEANHGKDIKKYFDADLKVPTLPFPRITMEEAYGILESKGHSLPRKERGDLDPDGEKMLYRHVLDKFGHEFVFVTDYPVGVRPFYHMRHPNNPALTKSFDLIWKGVEVTTGAQREHRHDILRAQAVEKCVDPEAISHYLGFFEHGCPPHGGYGFGLTRMLMMMLDAPNVREVTYLYRGPNRLTP